MERGQVWGGVARHQRFRAGGPKCSGVSAPSRRTLKIGLSDVHLSRPQISRAKDILEPLNNSSQIQIDLHIHLQFLCPFPASPPVSGSWEKVASGSGGEAAECVTRDPRHPHFLIMAPTYQAGQAGEP